MQPSQKVLPRKKKFAGNVWAIYGPCVAPAPQPNVAIVFSYNAYNVAHTLREKIWHEYGHDIGNSVANIRLRRRIM